MRKEGPQSTGPQNDGESPGGGDSETRPLHDLEAATERDLIDAAILGDMEAVAQLFEHYRPVLYTLCLRRLNDASLAEDAVQDAFIRAFTSFPNFDPSRALRPWLATIAFRACTDLQRRRSFTHYSADMEAATGADMSRSASGGHSGSALDAVLASEKFAELWKSLEVLPKRQRRVFLLYALDGWSCADIAAAEGVSVAAVHRLLFRARRKMRAARQSRPLPAIVLPFHWLRWKMQRMEERIRPMLGFHGDGLANTCVQAICLGTLAMVVATGRPAASFEGGDPIRPDKTVLSATGLSSMQPGGLQAAFQSPSVITAKPPVASQQSVSETAESLVDDVLNPNKNATPENNCCYSIAASSNYENDHMILASGRYLEMHVSFVSQDGGATWKPQVSRVPVGIQYNMVFSHGYLQDRLRIWTLGELGLQQSDDGGAIFRIVSPLLGPSLTISPSFGKGDSNILIGGKTLFEYNADIGVTQPGSLNLPPSWGQSYYTSVTFSPSYPSDPTVFISDKFGRGDLFNSRLDQTILYRCKGSRCDATEFPFPGPMAFRLSPRFEQDGLAYAFASKTLLVSNDGGRTFQEIQIPLPNQGYIADVAIWWNASSGPEIFVSVSGRTSGIFRSIDAGRSWSSSRIDVPGSRYGAKKLIVTPTGRLLAAGSEYGIACSGDLGQNWASRCPPE